MSNNKKNIRQLNDENTTNVTYYISSYLFVNPSMSNGIISWADTPAFLKLKIYEFQPDFTPTIADYLSNGKLFGELFKTIFAAAGLISSPFNRAYRQYHLNRAINYDVSGRITNLYSVPSDLKQRNAFSNNPIEVIMNMFDSGNWLNTYELPYWENIWLQSSYSKDFTNTPMSSVKGIGEMKETMQNIDYPLHPKFKTIVTENSRKITTEFYLVNHNLDWLIKNYKFINSIFSGSKWIFLKKCNIQSPNVYYVECPGRFKMYWAAMDVECTFDGKLRKLSTIDYENFNNEITYACINKDMLWPEYWRIKITITDLTPNNFNLHANYLLDGDNFSTFKMLTEKERNGNGMTIFKNIGDEIASFLSGVTVNLADTGMEQHAKLFRQNYEKMSEEFNKNFN